MAYGKIASTGVHIPFYKNDSLKDTASRWARHHNEQGRCLVKEHWRSMVVYEHGTEHAGEIRTPDLDDYMRLRKSAGLPPFSRAAAEVGFKGTVAALVIVHERRVVGMGRLIGDGRCFFQVTDIAVDPDRQGRGLGNVIAAGIMEYVDTELPVTA